ncbi:MAG: helix-turn-helix transcriptional regulator [Planctomycetes bacterium]|nr:helix-turn-helix transcriptional regulator [Planctomycetota bacterium]
MALDLDVMTRLTSSRRELARPAAAAIAGLRLIAVGSNRIEPPRGQVLRRDRPAESHLSWIVHGEVLLREPGPPRIAGSGDALLLPAGRPHRYASTDGRGWRALWIVFDCPGLDELGLAAGVLHPSSAAARACAGLAGLVASGGTGPRLAAALAVLLAELAAGTPTARADRIADEIAQRLRNDPLRHWDLPGEAAAAGLSWSALRQALRRRTGLAPERLLRAARLERGASVLMQGGSVGSAASAAGFADPFHFSRLFRRAYGVAPRSWRDSAG